MITTIAPRPETERARCVLLQAHRPHHTTLPAAAGMVPGFTIPGYPVQTFHPGTVTCKCGWSGPYWVGRHEYLPYAAVCPGCKESGNLNWATHTALVSGTILQGSPARGNVRVRLNSNMVDGVASAYHVRKDGRRDRRYSSFSGCFRMDEWTVVGGSSCT